MEDREKTVKYDRKTVPVFSNYSYICLVLINALFIGMPAVSHSAEAVNSSSLNSYIILTNLSETDPFYAVVEKLKGMRQGTVLQLDPDNINAIVPKLRETHARYAAVVVKPKIINEEFHTRILKALSSIDQDPFVDVPFGYITGMNPEQALKYLEFVEKKEQLKTEPRKFLLVSGEGSEKGEGVFSFFKNYSDDSGWEYRRYQADKEFTRTEYFPDMAGSGIIYFYAHGNFSGFFDVTVYNMRDTQADLFPSVIIANTCLLGVVSAVIDDGRMQYRVIRISPRQSFILEALGRGTIGIIAHMRVHGSNEYFLVPVWYDLAARSATLGDAMMNAYNLHVADHIVRHGAFHWSIPKINLEKEKTDGILSPSMLFSSYILYGDPAVRPFSERGHQILSVDTRRDGKETHVHLVTNDDIAYHAYDAVNDTQKGGYGYVFGSQQPVLHIDIPIAAMDNSSEGVSLTDVLFSSNRQNESSLKWTVEQTPGGATAHFFISVDMASAGWAPQQKIIGRGFAADIQFKVVPCPLGNESLSYSNRLLECTKLK